MTLLKPAWKILFVMAFTAVLLISVTVEGLACQLIDRSRPAQFISYESTSDERSEVTLRLHNPVAWQEELKEREAVAGTLNEGLDDVKIWTEDGRLVTGD